MAVNVLEKENIGLICYQNLECTPADTNQSSIIRIKSDLVGLVGIETILMHEGSNSLGFDCPKLDAISRRCSLNGQHCEQVPDSSAFLIHQLV